MGVARASFFCAVVEQRLAFRSMERSRAAADEDETRSDGMLKVMMTKMGAALRIIHRVRE